MTPEPETHNVDVGIRTLVMEAARKQVLALRRQERQTTGVPITTMASVGRQIMMTWRPQLTEAAGEIGGHPVDSAGNRLTERGHRKYSHEVIDPVPPRDTAADAGRARQLLDHLREVANPARGTTLGPIAAVRKAARREGLLDLVIEGKPLTKHISAAERAVLKPLRFTLPLDAYKRISERMRDHNCTMTRALEVGLQEFARVGQLPTKICGSESCPEFARTGLDPDTSCVPRADGDGNWKLCPFRPADEPKG